MPVKSDEVPEPTSELPPPSPLASYVVARERALLTVLTEIAGRKAALRLLDLTEEYLIDPEGLDNVLLIRGEEARRTVKRNRSIALNWLKALGPTMRRAIRKP